MTIPVAVLGAGGHARVLLEILKLREINVIGIITPDFNQLEEVKGIRVLGDDGAVLRFRSDSLLLVNGLGTVKADRKRMEIFDYFKQIGYNFATVIHPSAVVSGDTNLAEGVQIMAGAVIQPDTTIGTNSIVNTRASVDHDCVIGSHVHIAPGVIISGGVTVGDGSHVGTGAVIIQGVKIGAGVTVAAGAVVVNDLPDGSVARGVPAK